MAVLNHPGLPMPGFLLALDVSDSAVGAGGWSDLPLEVAESAGPMELSPVTWLGSVSCGALPPSSEPFALRVSTYDSASCVSDCARSHVWRDCEGPDVMDATHLGYCPDQKVPLLFLAPADLKPAPGPLAPSSPDPRRS